MNALNHPVRTAADVRTMLEQANMPVTAKRDMRSAISRICKMAGIAPAGLQLNGSSLRATLAAIRPAAHGIEARTFANIRSRFGAAMEWAGVIERLPRGAARRHPAWAPVASAVAGDTRLSNGLAAFMNWCANQGTAPAAVDDAALQRFLSWLETRTLRSRPSDLVRQIPALWAEARARAPGWPATELTRISFRPASPNLRWEQLPEGLQIDAEAYLMSRANPDLFDDNDDAPTRPLAESTIRLQRDHIRLAASVVVRHGVAVDELDRLAALVSVEAVKTVLRHYHQEGGGKPNAFAVGVACTLIHIARYHVKVPKEHLNALRKVARQLPPVPFDLTAKNKALLAELENEELRARILCLPEALAREVRMGLSKAGRLKFVKAQVAVAVEILLIAPVRARNLIELNWARNFKEPQGPEGKLVLYVPKDNTKTKRRDLTFEFPPDLARTIRWYRREILPCLGGDPNGDLFVSDGGKRKGQDTLSDQIIATIEKKIGIHMTPHQFRHLAAVLYLEAHPEDFQTVSDLLGHAFAKTTLVYAGASTRRASVAYGKLVVEQRQAAALKQTRVRRMSK